MENVFRVLALILIAQSLAALAGALRFARYALSSRLHRRHRYQPKAVVVVPCKGLEDGLEENIRALCTQDYREYELIFVTESEMDAAYPLLSKVIKQGRRSAWLVVAGEATGRGQKIHNLVTALETLNAIDRRAEVLVFADSDTRPARNWLADLIAPLEEKRVGATTGFRWYLPVQGGLLSHLLSVWSASALTLLGERSSFSWGGATAIRRENFERLGIRERWEGALSDDYVLSQAVREAGLRIKFVPACLTPTHADANFKELFEFTTRQMRITRVYAPRVWRLALVTQSLFNFAMWGGFIWLFLAVIRGRATATLPIMLAIILLLGAATGWVRVAVAARLLPAYRTSIFKQRWAYALLAPVSSMLYLCNLIASAWSLKIVWRGIGYELLSQSETRIWREPTSIESAEPLPRKRRRRRASASSSSPQ